jgi:hypothetical protein
MIAAVSRILSVGTGHLGRRPTTLFAGRQAWLVHGWTRSGRLAVTGRRWKLAVDLKRLLPAMAMG